MLRRAIIALSGLACAVALIAAVPASAKHKWGPYHWARTANPFTINVVDSVSSGWDANLDKAIADWSLSDVLDLHEEPGTVDASCAPIAGKVRVCNGNYNDNGWLGVAQIWTTTRNHISQGTSRMNDYYFNSPPYNTSSWRQLVMCQEPGHNLGLNHQDENFNNANLGTCMDYTANPDGPPSNVQPNQHDYDQLAKIYSHLDSFNTPKAAQPGATGQMRRAGDSDSLWVQDLPNGGQLFTWVLWKDPTKQHGPPAVP